MPMQSGQVTEVYAERKLAIVQHRDESCSVIGWTQGSPLSVGDRIDGSMAEGGWTRLENSTRGFEFHAYRHLHGCPSTDARRFCGT